MSHVNCFDLLPDFHLLGKVDIGKWQDRGPNALISRELIEVEELNTGRLSMDVGLGYLKDKLFLELGTECLTMNFTLEHLGGVGYHCDLKCERY